ncbi:hypothetical protein GN958_ATG11106, partial [Phytophthora infestans]
HLLHEEAFKRVCRLPLASFDRVCSLLVRLDGEGHARIKWSRVSVVNNLQMTKRFLSGGMIDNIRSFGGVDRSHRYKIVKGVMRAIAASAFRLQGIQGFMIGCVAASSDNDAGTVAEVRCYFSGHYMHPDIIVRTCCDALSCFVFVEIAHLGGRLPGLIETLKRGIYVAVDAAYTAMKRLLTSFTSLCPDGIYKDAFNYHLSKIRIRIEMTFQLLK